LFDRPLTPFGIVVMPGVRHATGVASTATAQDGEPVVGAEHEDEQEKQRDHQRNRRQKKSLQVQIEMDGATRDGTARRANAVRLRRTRKAEILKPELQTPDPGASGGRSLTPRTPDDTLAA
jgi:hypothetical protein